MPQKKNDPVYFQYGTEGPDSGIAARAIASAEPIHHSKAYFDYSGIAGNGSVSVREGFGRNDYSQFRPGESTPQTPKDLIAQCMALYRYNPILRNVVDMMSSFGSQGIEILHPVKSRQKAYRHWFQKVRGPAVSQHFLRTLYSGGNVFVKRGVAKLKESDLKDMQRGFASMAPDMEYEKSPKPKRNEIPINYTFLNPTSIETVHGELATFMGHPVYMLKVPSFLMTMIKTPKSPTEKQMVADLPSFIREPVQKGEKFILLDNDKLLVYHYMKDDWQTWADPLATSILNDLKIYDKMKLADQAALDGAISKIRLWKLGSLPDKIQPGQAAFKKLHDMLLAHVGGGSMDLIWDAAIDLQETSTDIVNFLGEEKYTAILKAIYAGLGIPQALTGGGGSSFSNNAISLKTLIERLQYGRNLLTSFWQNELKLLQEALGDKQPARVIYDNMTLYDEAAEKMIWIQLADRSLISDETIQERFGLIPEVEQMRMKRENTARENGSGKIPAKAGPFHNAQFDQDVTHTALQQGTISPTEAGVKKKPKQKGDKSLIDHQNKMNEQKSQQEQELHQQNLKFKEEEHKQKLTFKEQQQQRKNKGQPQQGRPKNSKDTVNRKQRRVLPRTKAGEVLAVLSWARAAQKTIADELTPRYLALKNKKKVPSLTVAQTDELERLKLAVLWNMPPMTMVTAEYVQNIDLNPLPYSEEGAAAVATLADGRKLTFEETRELQLAAYILHLENKENAEA